VTVTNNKDQKPTYNHKRATHMFTGTCGNSLAKRTENLKLVQQR